MDTVQKLECASNLSMECKTNFLTTADLIEHVFNIHFQYLCAFCLDHVSQSEDEHIAHITQCDSPPTENRKESCQPESPNFEDEVIEIADEEDNFPSNEAKNEKSQIKKSPKSTKKKKTNNNRNDNKDEKEIPTRRVATRSQSRLSNNDNNMDMDIVTVHVTGRKRGRKPKEMKTPGNEKKQTVFPCGIAECSSSFSDMKQLYEHRCEMHPKSTFYVCKECNYVPYYNILALKKHQSTNH